MTSSFTISSGREVAVRLTAMHIGKDGKRYLVMHGDEFDGVVKYAKWLAYLGDTAYEIAISVNTWVNRLRRGLGLPYWSLSAYLKYRVRRR